MKNDLLIIKARVDAKMFGIIRDLTSAHSSDTLLMAVKTFGGDPMYAYRAMVFLRSIYKDIIYAVFDESMSAGTLMALGANSIYLDDGACLGPLDLQIPHPRDDSRISTLDVRDTASSTVFEASGVMLKLREKNLKEGMPMSIAVDAAIRMALDLYKPIMDKIDPFHLHESYRNAELSTSYGANLLLSGMIEDESEAVKISIHLANDYSDHGYAIMKEEARNLGLNIMDNTEMLGSVDLNTVRSYYNKVGSDNIVFISAVDNKVSKQDNNKKEDKK